MWKESLKMTLLPFYFANQQFSCSNLGVLELMKWPYVDSYFSLYHEVHILAKNTPWYYLNSTGHFKKTILKDS